MSGILRIALAALLVGAVAIAPASAGVPVAPVSLPDSADEAIADSFDRSPRSTADKRPQATGERLPLPTRPAVVPAARPPAGPFYTSVPPHVRFCVWRE